MPQGQEPPKPPGSTIPVKLVAPRGYPTPFEVLVNHARSLGLQVKETYPEVNAIHGSATPEALEKLQQIPGVAVSPVQKVSWGV